MISSIGYKSISIDKDIPYDSINGIIPNIKGRVMNTGNLNFDRFDVDNVALSYY